ncbi:Putative ribonuclease H protein At1g65750, partial [Linum perenne]
WAPTSLSFPRPSKQLQETCSTIVRDCLETFSVNLGICSITRVELRGVDSCLQLAWDLSYRQIQLHLDLQCAGTLLQTSDYDDHGHVATYHAFELLCRDCEVWISHVYRESNHVANHLNNKCHSFFTDFHYIEQFDFSLVY